MDIKGVGMINISDALRYYGFKDGKFNETADIMLEIPDKAEKEFGKIEKDTAIDTAEEFLTAVNIIVL